MKVSNVFLLDKPYPSVADRVARNMGLIEIPCSVGGWMIVFLSHRTILYTYKTITCIVELSGTKLRTLQSHLLGGILENQNSDFVMA